MKRNKWKLKEKVKIAKNHFKYVIELNENNIVMCQCIDKSEEEVNADIRKSLDRLNKSYKDIYSGRKNGLRK